MAVIVQCITIVMSTVIGIISLIRAVTPGEDISTAINIIVNHTGATITRQDGYSVHVSPAAE